MLLYLYTFCCCFLVHSTSVTQYISFGLDTFGAWLSVSVYALDSGDAAWRVEHRICKNKTHAVVERKVSSRKSCVCNRGKSMMLRCYFSGSPYVHVNPRIYFFSIFLSCTSTPKKVAHRREPQKKKSRAYMRIKKKCTWKGVPHRRRQHVRSGQ